MRLLGHTEPRPVDEAEAALRGRLRPCQLEDLDRTQSFCIVRHTGMYESPYRVFAPTHEDMPEYRQEPNWDWWLIPGYRFVMDNRGCMRNFWFLDRGHKVVHGWDACLAVVLFTAVGWDVAQNSCCTSFPQFTHGRAPTDYGGRI